MNKVILVGNLSKDPEVRYSQSGEPVAVARFTLAINRKFKREGEPDADFIDCVAFGKQGEFVEKYFKKGMKAAVSGRLTVSSWDDKQTGQRKWRTEVTIEDVEFAESKTSFESRMGSAPREAAPAPSRNAAPAHYEPEGFSAIAESIDDDDLPF
ncbi:MAG: single-stranded DNA-binding protein [Defluviitaleaceae bacterium]|nr:single-stranded DNA-binding protein [Defluviitaleaceae bacterium]